MLFDVIGWVIIGVLAGLYASRLVGQESYTGHGAPTDLGLALVGAILGGIIARLLSLGGSVTSDAFVWPSLIFAALGTIIALSLSRATSGQELRH